jgi:hypothetical protein
LHNDPSQDSTEHQINEPQVTVSLQDIIRPLYVSRFWINLFAYCLIFYSSLITITGVGVLVAWLPIWIGILLLMISRSLKTAFEEDNEEALQLSLSRFKTLFTILGVFSLILIVVSLYLLKYAFDKSLF